MRPPISDPFPQDIRMLWKGVNMTPAHFRIFKEKVRIINSNLSFASLCNTKEVNVAGHGPWVYKIQGQVVRRMSSAEAAQGVCPRFSQLYFLDNAEAHDALRANETCSSLPPFAMTIMLHMLQVLRDVNPYAERYMAMRELVNQYRDSGTEVPSMSLVFNNTGHVPDHRRYNAPSSTNDVAAIIVGDLNHSETEKTFCVTLNQSDMNPGNPSYITEH